MVSQTFLARCLTVEQLLFVGACWCFRPAMRMCNLKRKAADECVDRTERLWEEFISCMQQNTGHYCIVCHGQLQHQTTTLPNAVGTISAAQMTVCAISKLLM